MLWLYFKFLKKDAVELYDFKKNPFNIYYVPIGCQSHN